MKLVVSDTGRVNYLTHIGQIEILPKFFEKILIPAVVFQELIHSNAPAAVRDLIGAEPFGLEVRKPRFETGPDSSLRSLDAEDGLRSRSPRS